MTLYQELRKIETANSGFAEVLADLQQKTDGLFLDHSFPLELKEKPEFDVPQIQRYHLQRYQNNPVMADAINGEKSITKTLDELSVVNQGIKAWLPRRKDPEHNAKIDALSKLVAEPDYLKANGIFAWDNFVTGAAYGSVFMLGIAAFARAITPHPSSEYGILASLVGVVGFAWGFLGHFETFAFPGRIEYGAPKEQAQYLDHKITELL